MIARARDERSSSEPPAIIADRARIEPFDAIELDLALLWMDVALPTRASEATGEDYEYALDS